MKHTLKTFPNRKPLPRNVIDCNRLIRKQREWKEGFEEELRQLKQEWLSKRKISKRKSDFYFEIKLINMILGEG